MALRISQLAFDRLISDVETEVLGPPTGDGHKALLRSSFMTEAGPLIPKTTTLAQADQEAIAEKAQTIFCHHCWVNLSDPLWDFVKTRMIEHMNDVASTQQPTAASADPEGGILGWAPPRPRGKHVKGKPVACKLCGQPSVAPVDHLAYQHGIDNPANRHTLREAHVVKMHGNVVAQHLVQDAAELNDLMANILAVERKICGLNPGYQGRHGLPVIGRWETDRNHSSFNMNGKQGQTKQALVDKLVGLRMAGLRQGRLYSREGWGTYGEVLADLEGVLARMEE
ncbi:hypothetical protein INS49_009276 [Diaporthe citri]|uniref:uncharacterized protein n=1 Tax=Diaporthe citri TaxID=83186 RepID=UPI001C80C36B|nr:uncharacterized protein INS49_009276 [Diaporthe citri]KAG6361056.1 hypothetical protein INS49_009276 [Diaporthe citri]